MPLDVALGAPRFLRLSLPWRCFGRFVGGRDSSQTTEKRVGSDAGPTLRPSRQIQSGGGVLLESIDTVSLVRAHGGCRSVGPPVFDADSFRGSRFLFLLLEHGLFRIRRSVRHG